MEKLMEITNEEFSKIVGATKHPKTQTIEIIESCLPNIDELLSAKKWKKEELQKRLSLSWETLSANAFIVSEDQNKNKEPFFDTHFGMNFAHTNKYEMTYVTIKKGAYSKLN